eukprot:7600846-Pyramimonas_sp.AAC.1
MLATGGAGVATPVGATSRPQVGILASELARRSQPAGPVALRIRAVAFGLGRWTSSSLNSRPSASQWPWTSLPTASS